MSHDSNSNHTNNSNIGCIYLVHSNGGKGHDNEEQGDEQKTFAVAESLGSSMDAGFFVVVVWVFGSTRETTPT